MEINTSTVKIFAIYIIMILCLNTNRITHTQLNTPEHACTFDVSFLLTLRTPPKCM